MLAFLAVMTDAKAEKIQYGYDYRGNYVPQKVGDEKIQYGYDHRGNYVPQKVGNRKIKYERNIRNIDMPVELEDEE